VVMPRGANAVTVKLEDDDERKMAAMSVAMIALRNLIERAIVGRYI